jgi:periplasmic divalent cation tolerance protein
MAEPCVQITTTAPDEDTAERIAADLLDRHLAACVQVVGPIRSHYRWEGERRADSEWLCLVKTRAALTETVTGAIVALHPYDEPEIIATPISGGAPGYLAWVASESAGG